MDDMTARLKAKWEIPTCPVKAKWWQCYAYDIQLPTKGQKQEINVTVTARRWHPHYWYLAAMGQISALWQAALR